MIDFDAYYGHRRKGFTVVVGEPSWWDLTSTFGLGKGPRRIKPPLVLVMRCGMHEGRSKWLMNAASFEKTYEKQTGSPQRK